MSENRVSFTCQVLPVVKALIAAEAKARRQSQGKLLDDLVLAACRSPEAVLVIQDYARKDPLLQALAEAAARSKPPIPPEPAKSKRKITKPKP